MKIKDKYAIVGVGYTEQGSVPNRTALSFYEEACANAIKDADLNKDDIDGLICYRRFPPAANEFEVMPYLLAQKLGLSPKMLTMEASCARTQLINAIGWLEMGFCKYVIVSYADNACSGTGSKFADSEFDSAAFGFFGAAARHGLVARRAMQEFHTGPEIWKEIAVGQRKWANLNPKAMMYNKQLSYDDYFKSPWVVEPFRLNDCCLKSDGGRAYIVTTTERARDLKHHPVLIMGIGQFNPCRDIQHAQEMPFYTGAKISGETAIKMAGITLDDIDACEIYDCFTYTVEATLADYGFFKKGGAFDWFKGGTIGPGGRMPVNTSGGMLSEAYFMGMTHLTEGVMQLMGRCGKRQLGPITNNKEPEIILCSDHGGTLQTHSTVILRRM